MSKNNIPTQSKKPMGRSLIDLMKRTDDIFKTKFINPDEDYMTYDHIAGTRENHGDFVKMSLDTEINYECRIECKVQDVVTGAVNWLVIHYISLDTPKPKLLIIDLDCMCRAYDDANLHTLIHAVSTVRPIKEGRFATLLREGEISRDSNNIKVELTTENFPMVI